LPKEAEDALGRSRLVYWALPAQASAEFRSRAAAGSDAENPVFRADDPAAMVEWLKGLLSLGGPSPVAAYQDVEPEDSPDPTSGLRLQDILRNEVKAFVQPVLPEDDDEKEIHAFSGRALESTLDLLARRRPIIIAHDFRSSGNAILNRVSPRKEILGCFRDIQRRADPILAGRGVHQRDVFWLACIHRGQGLLSPGTKRLPVVDVDRWRVLELLPSGDGFALESGIRREAILEEMMAWANPGAAPRR
jgi:hypothetical protein